MKTNITLLTAALLVGGASATIHATMLPPETSVGAPEDDPTGNLMGYNSPFSVVP